MLSLQLMVEVSRRFGHARGMRDLLDDACVQARYCLDATDEVQDGAEWYEDEEADCCGVVPRIVQLRA